MNLSEIKFIYFDIDDTLLDQKAAATNTLLHLHNEFSEEIGHISADQFIERFHIENSAVWLAMARREMSPDDVKVQRFTRTLAHFGNEHHDVFQPIGTQLSSFYLDKYKEFWQLQENASDVIEAAERTAPVGLLSNGFPEQQYGKLRRFGWEKRFCSVVLSADAGAMKPDRQIFEFARNAVSIDNPSAMLYIGDSYETDIIGAKKAGWNAVWLNRNEADAKDNDADLTIASLSELLQYFS